MNIEFVALIVLLLYSCHITGIVFSIALLNGLLIYLRYDNSILFCVISAAKLFWRLQNVQQDYTLNP